MTDSLDIYNFVVNYLEKEVKVSLDTDELFRIKHGVLHWRGRAKTLVQLSTQLRFLLSTSKEIQMEL